MCYDGALVLPSSYAVMNEEEMTYVEGGATYKISKKTVYKKASVAVSDYLYCSRVLKVWAVGMVICSAVAGALVGQVVGAIIGGCMGLVAGSVVWNWASACSGAAIAASNYSGNTMLKCVEQMTRTGDLVISISKK